MTGESPCNLPGCSLPYIVKLLKLKKGRLSGGMFIFTKPIHRKGITVLKQSKYLIWMKLDKSIFNFKRNIYLCFVYIKPYQSKDLSETIFSELQPYISG